MEIRRARADDASAIVKMEEEYFADPWSQKDVFSYISTEGGMCFVAERDGAIIAYVIGRIVAPEGEIYRIAVKESERGRGVGYRLLSYATKTERGRGLEALFLEVREENVPARRLYSSFGFREISMRKNYYQNPQDNAIVMLMDRWN